MIPVSFGSSIVEPGKSGSNTAAANFFDQQPAPAGQNFVDGAKYDLVTKHRRGSYHLALVLKKIETLESDWLYNIKNVILYSLPYILASGIKKYWNEGSNDHNMGGTTASQATQLFCGQYLSISWVKELCIGFDVGFNG